MSDSKMREALEEAYKTGRSDMLSEIASAGNDLTDQAERVNEIAQRYGDLELTRDEVRNVVDDVVRAFSLRIRRYGPDESDILVIDEILSRHLGESGDTEHSLDREVGELQGELIELTNRVAAIERRVLADGHSEDCTKSHYPKYSVAENYMQCTCGHDKLREGRK